MPVECKCYLSSTLGVDLGRSLLGLIDDIYTDGRFFVSTQNTGSVDQLFSRHRREYEIGLRDCRPGDSWQGRNDWWRSIFWPEKHASVMLGQSRMRLTV